MFNSLMGSTSIFETLSFRARRTDKDSENDCAVTNRIYLVNQVLQLIEGHDSVTTVPLARRDLAALATAAVAAALWHGHLLIPMTFSAELDCSDLLALICQSRGP